MSGSKLLEQAIVDAQALRDSAFKSAQATLLEKFAPQVKEAVEKILEQEEPAAEQGAPEDALAGDIPPGTDFGGAPPDISDKGYVAGTAKDVPLAATDGEKLCPCPDDDEEVTLQIDLGDLASQLNIGKDAEEEMGMQATPTGMQDQPPAAGGATQLQEDLELESIELDEDMDKEYEQVQGDGMRNTGVDASVFEEEELTEVDLDEAWSELDEEGTENLQEYEMITFVKRVGGYRIKNPDGSIQHVPGELRIVRRNDEGEEDDLGPAPPGSVEGEEIDAPRYHGRSRSRYSRRRYFEESEKVKNKQKADLNKDGKLSSYEKARGAAIEKSMQQQKMKESKTKQLISASAELLKEHQNTVKLMEKKDAQIQKLLEENTKFSSTIEEMSQAFKKLEEVNLLNAHLFYQNQVLKSASLNERQKTNIVEAISKADSVSEAKAVYETLINSMGGTAEKERSPKSLNEAINKKSSFRLPHKQAEQPADPNKDRWLKLAGIK